MRNSYIQITFLHTFKPIKKICSLWTKWKDIFNLIYTSIIMLYYMSATAWLQLLVQTQIQLLCVQEASSEQTKRFL